MVSRGVLMIETTSRALHRCMVLSVFQRERERERERERDRERQREQRGKQRSSMVEILPVLENKKLNFDLSKWHWPLTDHYPLVSIAWMFVKSCCKSDRETGRQIEVASKLLRLQWSINTNKQPPPLYPTHFTLFLLKVRTSWRYFSNTIECVIFHSIHFFLDSLVPERWL